MTVAEKMLVVDADGVLRGVLAEHFRLYNQFAIDEAASGTDALTRSHYCPYDVVLLNVGLPDMDGREVCRLMRRTGVRPPIIILTGAATDADIILGLDAGADDYVTKPFRLDVLAARIRAQLRAHSYSGVVVYTVGPYAFRPDAEVLVNRTTKATKSLTGKETALLKFLCIAGDQPVDRDILLTVVWNYSPEANSHTLQTYIYRLRQKIEKDPANPRILVTEAEGYHLIR